MFKTLARLSGILSLCATLAAPAMAEEQAEVRIGTDGGYLPWTAITPEGKLDRKSVV